MIRLLYTLIHCDGHFIIYQSKEMQLLQVISLQKDFQKITSDETISFTSVQRHAISYCCISHLSKPGVKTVFKKSGHKPYGC